jgi:hypothetical protein
MYAPHARKALRRAGALTAPVAILVCACLSLRVRPVAAQPSPTAIIDRVRIDSRKQIDFHAAAFPETLYVGQQTTYQLAVFLTQEVQMRLRRNPEFIPPESRGLLAYELGRARRVSPGYAPAYQALVFQRALFPVAPGKLVVPAPQLSYALPQSSSYFSREERHLVHAESAHLVVRPLPEVGQPAAFSGAVGVLRADARLDTSGARVGDPLLLTVQVSGTGNVKLLPRPALHIEWASAVPGTERVQVDTSGPLVRGTKEFEWVLTPTRDGRVTLPAITYDYFDPYRRVYAAAVTMPIELPVRAGTLAPAETGESAALLPLRAGAPPSMTATLLRGHSPMSMPALVAALALVLVAPLPAIGLMLRRRAAEAPPRIAPLSTIDRLRGLAALDGDSGDDARQARRAFHVALAARLGVAPQVLTSRRQTRRILRRRGVTRAGTDCVLELLDDLDVHGFANGNGNHGASAVSFAKRVTDCYAVVDGQAIHEATGARRSGLTFGNDSGAGLGKLVLFASLCLPFAGLIAQSTTQVPLQDSAGAIGVTIGAPAAQPEEAARALREANDAYQRRQFADAQDRFAGLVRTNPTNADLLVNWGTAAWAAGDTVHAVIAWQRAARLYPLASDIQERMGLLPAGARGGVADVPMVPVLLLQWSAIALWIFGWGLAAWLAVRTRDDRRGGATTLLRGVMWVAFGGAVGGGAVSFVGQRALDPSTLAVVMRSETMFIAPGTDAEAMGGVTTGDVVKRLETQGTWQRVQHADGREGWLPSLRLVALSADEDALSMPNAGPSFEPALTPIR